MKTMKNLTAAIVMAVAFAWVSPVSAEQIDGSKSAVCAALSAVVCISGEGCAQGSSEAINVPKFFHVNFAEQTIRATRPNGKKIASKIRSKTREKGELILQGIENGRGWSMAISEKSGRSTISVAGDEIAYTVFGACTAP
jgi:hypothetical protein